MHLPTITIKIKDFGSIKLELYPEIAPNTVANILTYVKENYYNGLTFHRVIKGFMIQGGWGAEKHAPIKGEFNVNGHPNNLAHEKGVISMARTNVYNSATAQFFIVHETAKHLDGQYAAFGKVVEGLDIVDKIAGVKTNHQDKPLVDVVIETFDYELNDYQIPAVKYFER